MEHLDAKGRALSVDSAVKDCHYRYVHSDGRISPILGYVTRLYLEGGSNKPLASVKFGGMTVTRYPASIELI